MKFLDRTRKMFRLKTVVLIFVSILLLTGCSAPKSITGSDFNEDLLQLDSRLKKLYPGLYAYESRENYENRLSQSLVSPGDSLTYLDAYKNMAAFLSGNQDLHISVGLHKKFVPKNRKTLPLILRRFDNDFYIAYNQSEDSTLLRGDKIPKIDQEPPNQIYESLKNLYGADMNNPYSKNYYAEYSFPNLYYASEGHKDSISIGYIRKGQEKEVNLAGLTSKEKTEFQKKRYKESFRKNFDFKILDSLNHLAILDIISFAEPKKKFPRLKSDFKKNLRKNFKKIEKQGVENLIIDLRGNGGGSVANVHRLISYVSQENFRIYDSISISKPGFNKVFKPWLVFTGIGGRLYFNKKSENEYYRSFKHTPNQYKPTKKYNFAGDLYVLVDGGSYSATAFTISLLKNMDRAVFVGTPPGGANWGSFAGKFYYKNLKHSGLKVRIPLMRLVHNSEGSSEDLFVQPDYWVSQGFDDFLKRKDSLKEFVKSMVLLQNSQPEKESEDP